jgi:hypothetical protein
VDLKFFFDSRPSLLAWVMVALSYAAVQYERYNTLSFSMILYLIFSFVYMFDFFYYEEAFITGFEIIEERFGNFITFIQGFQLLWGNTVWMPFVILFHLFKGLYSSRIIFN